MNAVSSWLFILLVLWGGLGWYLAIEWKDKCKRERAES